ncbi:MAG: glycosyltransferase family 2 protein [Alistipes sp.]|nr:glycosyltransferase family 2 protein [Alistipes sp.]
MHKVSIIIPVFNAQKYIAKLIRNLDEQTCKDFIAIFVDDASSDDSVQILQEESKKVGFEIKIIQHLQNEGPGKARNDAMESVSTPFFTFIDADDWVSSNYIEELLSSAQKSNADVVIGNAYKIWPNGQKKRHWDIASYQKHTTPVDMACIVDYGPWGKLFNTDLWDSETTSFPTNIRCEDMASVSVLLNKARKFAFAPTAYYYYYQTPISRSRARGLFYNDIYESCKILESRIDNPYIMEYRYITSIGYGVLMNAILAKKDNKTIEYYIDILKGKFPNGYKHPLVHTIPLPKRIFIYLAYCKQIWLLRILVKIAK